jgi:hypothetical protein
MADWPCEGGCLISYPFAFEEESEPDQQSTRTVADTMEFFARVCFACDQAMGEPAAVHWLLNWFDESPRDEMWALLLPEVELALARRNAAVA